MQAVEITKEQVIAAFEVGGYTINERFKETGFLYFPTDGSKSKNSLGQGRVFWMVEKHEYESEVDRRIDQACGVCQDSISISPGWGFPSEEQRTQILELLKLYVLFARRARAEKTASPLREESDG